MPRVKLKRGSRKYKEGIRHISSLCSFFGEFTDVARLREESQKLEKGNPNQEMAQRMKALLDKKLIIIDDEEEN